MIGYGFDGVDGTEPTAGGSGPEIGSFRQGSLGSQWALGRYLVGRAVAEALSRGLLLLAVVLLAGAAGIWAAGSTFWGVVVGILAVAVVLMRRVVLAVLRRLRVAGGDPALDARLGQLVAATRKDVLAELRRLGLPSRSWTLPLLAVRLLGRRRRETADKLRAFQIDRVVPAARLDEVHLLLQSASRHGAA